MKLRVGSFNILNTCVNYQARRPHIISTIREMDRDVLGIQEVNFEGNTELDFQDLYKTEYVLLPAPMILPKPDFRIDGNALLIKHDIEILERHSLLYAGQQRVAQILKLRKDGVVFLMANTHLDHLTDETRLGQVSELLEFANRYREFPMICTGDYNFTPGSEPYVMMSQEFRSANVEANGKEPDITYPTELEGVFPLAWHYRCIDYIWVRGNIAVKSTEVMKKCGEGTMWASDHFPIVAELEISIST